VEVAVDDRVDVIDAVFVDVIVEDVVAVLVNDCVEVAVDDRVDVVDAVFVDVFVLDIVDV